MTVERLRRDIDAGRTGDKSPGSDPAAAPLGTDDEAAGTPVAPAVVALERRRARRIGDGLDSRINAPARDEAPAPLRPRHPVLALLTMGLAIFLAVAGLAWLMGYWGTGY